MISKVPDGFPGLISPKKRSTAVTPQTFRSYWVGDLKKLSAILHDDFKHHNRIFFCGFIDHIPAGCRPPMVVIIITIAAGRFVNISLAVIRVGFKFLIGPARGLLFYFVITVGFPGRLVIPIIPVLGKR